MEITIRFGESTDKSERRSKGESLLELVSDYVVIDLETTGLDPQWNDIIELGAIRVSGGCIVDSFSALVNPGYEIDEFITEITGITNEMLSSALAIVDVLPVFLDFIDYSIVVGHNVNFDVNFLYDNCIAVLDKPFGNDFIDTMRLSRRLFPQNRHHRLCDLVERLEIGDAVEHRALADVEETNRCYEFMKQYMSENGISIESLRPAKNSFSVNGIHANTTE